MEYTYYVYVYRVWYTWLIYVYDVFSGYECMIDMLEEEVCEEREGMEEV